MASGGVPAPPGERGREPPFFFFFFLNLLPRWEKGFHSGPWSPWSGRGESPSEIGSVSLSLSVSVFSSLPFHRFMYIWRSVTPIGLKPSPWFYYKKLAFLRPKKGINRLTGGPRGSGARPLPRAHLGHRFTLIFLPDFPNIPKISSVRFYPVWNPFDMGFLRNIKHATNRNWHWALDQYVSPKNNIKSCQKYTKVVEYWHGTIKNYRYDGDVSASPSLIPARPWVGKW